MQNSGFGTQQEKKKKKKDGSREGRSQQADYLRQLLHTVKNETGARRSRGPPSSCERILKLKPKLGHQEFSISLPKN